MQKTIIKKQNSKNLFQNLKHKNFYQFLKYNQSILENYKNYLQ